jgi:Transposase DDE domain
MNPEALTAFNTITNCISSPHIKASVDTMLHNFLKANGNPRPQQSIAKSPSALSRMLNEYALPGLALIRESRALIKQKIWLYFSSRKKRRPRLELIIDMTTLEKTGEFKELPLSFFNEKYGLHLVVLYVVIGNQRFIWAIRIWEGKDTRTWVDHALSMLRCTPNWFKDRFKCRVLADTGFGTTEFIEGCTKLELPVVVGMRVDRKTEEGLSLDQLRAQGAMHFLKGCGVPVYVAWYKLKQKHGAFEWRYVVSTVAANAKTIVGWGKRRWRIEAFFKTMKSRFGLDQFGQQTRLGVLRFLLIAFIAYLLAFWTSFSLEGFEIPDWIALAAQAQLLLVTWVVVFELERKQVMVAEVLKFKETLIA